MLHFEHLDKSQKAQWLPCLFDLLYSNMQCIVPSHLPREQAWAQWVGQVGPALEKAPRQILLCFADDTLSGFLQYYTRGDLLMIEELQISSAYRRTGVFGGFCRQLAAILPRQIAVVEAYADPGNVNSRRLMKKLGMEELPQEGSDFIHLRGSAAAMKRIFMR